MKTTPAAMLWELIGRLAHTPLTVRISGEPGVGKGAIARLLSTHYPHPQWAYKKFDCRDLGVAAGPGAGQRACTNAALIFEAAMAHPEKSVFYLENVEALSLDQQIRLHEMLAGNTLTHSPWVLASSIAPLDQYLGNRQFSQQLLEDLDTIHIALPTLRSRRERIPQLLAGILTQKGDGNSFGLAAMPDAKSMHDLVQYHWPGNWRQLHQVALKALGGMSWQRALDGTPEPGATDTIQLSDRMAIHIMSGARFHICKERVLEALMHAASLEDVGLLDLAIFNEAVTQIDDCLYGRDTGDDGEG